MYVACPDDHGLPEVVPSTAPEALAPEDAKRVWGLEEHNPKYPVLADPVPLFFPVPSEKDTFATTISPRTPDGANPPGGLDALASGGVSSALPPSSADHSDAEAQGMSGSGTEKKRTCCGLSKKTFIVAAALILALGALAGGLGGGLSRGHIGNTSKGDTQSVNGGNITVPTLTHSAATSTSLISSATATAGESASSTNGSSSSTSASSTSTSATPTPTSASVLGNLDFSFNGWASQQYRGTETPTYKEQGFINLPFNVSSYVWDRNNTVCCLTFCQGLNTSVGYWCDDKEQPAASASFDRIYVWCDQDVADRKGMCS